MFINISEMSDKGFKINLDSSKGKEVKILRDTLSKIDIKTKADVLASLEILKDKDILSVKGSIKATISFHCSRCLKELTEDIDRDFSDTYLIKKFDESLEGVEVEISSKELGADYIATGNVDTDDFFIEQLASSVPSQSLCSDDCKGLCQKCGSNLNNDNCDCIIEDKVDPRFAGLKNFKIK